MFDTQSFTPQIPEQPQQGGYTPPVKRIKEEPLSEEAIKKGEKIVESTKFFIKNIDVSKL